MANKTKNNIYFSIEVASYLILLITFLFCSFCEISDKNANYIYIAFITITFGWLFINSFIFTKSNNAVHYKMFNKQSLSQHTSQKVKYRRKGLIGVLILWITYILIFALLKILKIITWQIFLIIICITLILNSIFTRKICFLSLLFLHNKNNCCKNCGINAWDFAIFASPLLFAPYLSLTATLINIVIFIISVVILTIWEILYHKHPERFYPETNQQLSCKHCLKQCKFKNLKN